MPPGNEGQLSDVDLDQKIAERSRAIALGLAEAGADIAIVGRNEAELSCLQLAFAYDEATRWVEKSKPALLGT